MSDVAADAPGAVDRITVGYRVRFDECGPDGLARTSSLLRYAQDVAWVHSERKGFGRDWYAARSLAWVVRSAELRVLRPVPLGVTLDLTTGVEGQRRVWACRRTVARDADGASAFEAHTDWVITGAGGVPVRIPAEFPAAFGVPDGGFDPVKVPLPDAPPGSLALPVVVRPQDLDPMGHVNNAAYLDYLEETLAAMDPAPDERVAVPRTVRIEYLTPARPGARLQATAWRPSRGAAIAWRLTDADGRDLVRASVAAGATDRLDRQHPDLCCGTGRR